MPLGGARAGRPEGDVRGGERFEEFVGKSGVVGEGFAGGGSQGVTVASSAKVIEANQAASARRCAAVEARLAE